MKRIISVILSVLIIVSLLSACGESGSKIPEGEQAFCVRDTKGCESVTAVFMNTENSDTKEVEMKKQDQNVDYTDYVCTADPDKFNRVIIKYDSKSTIELAFNRHVLGWVLGDYKFMPYDTGYSAPEPERKTFDYEDRDKDVFIWTPESYTPDGEKCSVIYMTDGQNIFNPSATSYGSWAVAESVRAMAAQGGENCVIVGVKTAGNYRDEELTPDIGEVLSADYEDGHGEYFSDFIVNTVMPYINKNYNVYTDREHTHICGSSSGGIESFYIAMEHPDKFASVGALSPAFLLYSAETWEKYLGEKDFSEYAPMVYIYSGNNDSDDLEKMICSQAKVMPETLKKIGYPEDKVVTEIYEKGAHNETYWRAVFPDYLKYAFPKTAK